MLNKFIQSKRVNENGKTNVKKGKHWFKNIISSRRKHYVGHSNTIRKLCIDINYAVWLSNGMVNESSFKSSSQSLNILFDL